MADQQQEQWEQATELAIAMLDRIGNLFTGHSGAVISEACARMTASVTVQVAQPQARAAALREVARWLNAVAATHDAPVAAPAWAKEKVAGHG